MEPDQPKIFKALKGTLILCPCLGMNLARLVYGWSPCLRGVNVVVSGDTTLPCWLWLSVFRHLCLRYPIFSLPTLSVWFSSLQALAVFPVQIVYKMPSFLINLLGICHQLIHNLLVPATAFVFFTFYLLHFSCSVFPLDTLPCRTLISAGLCHPYMKFHEWPAHSLPPTLNVYDLPLWFFFS